MNLITLLSLTKTPLLICRSLNNWRVLRTLGATWLTLSKSTTVNKMHHNLRILNLPSNTNNKGQLRFCRNIEVSCFLSLTGQPDFIPLLRPVFLDVFFSAPKDFNTPGTASFHVLLTQKDLQSRICSTINSCYIFTDKACSSLLVRWAFCFFLRFNNDSGTAGSLPFKATGGGTTLAGTFLHKS